ncbi:MAG: dTMP kinase [Ruminococcaceae bacterium]|nr:dTMP kinase [Oscillospiraceae bacterium]
MSRMTSKGGTDMSRPLFIVFEGIDGCGKTTQLTRLADALKQKGRQVMTTAEPTDSTTGKLLRAALSGNDPRTPTEMAALFTLDRIHHNVSQNGIAATLRAGTDVISDRYYYSSLAYQGSLCDYDWVRRMNLNCPDIRKPDLCIFLDISPDTALARIGKRGEAKEIYEKKETLSLFRETFLRVFASLDDRVEVIDAEGTPDEIATRVMAAVETIL